LASPSDFALSYSKAPFMPKCTRSIIMTSNVMQEKETTQEITIVYTNWKGETSIRRILPKQISFGSNEWHPTPQWLLEAYDLDKKDIRNFALKDIRTWF
jgi:hypothetical protein